MTAVQGRSVHFMLDPKASLLTVQAFASGIVAVIAHSPKFAMRQVLGEFNFDPNNVQNSSIRLTATLRGLEIMDDVTSLDRREIERVMFDEVLEAAVYPVAEFQSTRIIGTKTAENMYRVNIAGSVSLHGQKRDLAFDSHIVAGEDTLRGQGSFSLLQRDFGLQIASIAGGTLKLKDELRFGFFLVGRRAN